MPERNPFFPEISGRLGLGCMRMPRAGDGVDMPLTEKLVDLLMARGYNYFDTAHGYVDGKSETALRRLLVERYPRESFVLADKLSTAFFERQEDIRPLFESQLAACGVDYFDFYLMHAQREDLYEKFMACRAYETAAALKAEGKIRHFGVSFHGTAAFLERLLDEQPGIEAVQIQFNYLDYPDPVIQSGACYEVCRARGVPVFVMEPVKGGSLARLPQAAARELGPLGDVSQAGLALRYAAGFDGVAMVLSGMNSVEQLEENAALMERPAPLTEAERAALDRVRDSYRTMDLIGCTGCRYCVDGCPARIAIPDVLACVNNQRLYGGDKSAYYYQNVYTYKRGRASDCVRCGQCEHACPQRLPIRELPRRTETGGGA